MPGYGPGPYTQQGNGIATAAMVLGIIGCTTWWIPIIQWFAILFDLLALIFGVIGMKKANRIGGKGKGVAITGLVLGIVGLAFWVLIIILILAFIGTMASYG